MIYPFAFGQIFTDKYAGSASIMGISKAELAGDITVTADAFGTLILPDVTLANTLRVKTEKTGLEVNPCSSSVVRIVRYSWYAPGYRYPVLVLSTTESKTGIKEPVITKSAFLNVQQNANAVTVTSFTDRSPGAYGIGRRGAVAIRRALAARRAGRLATRFPAEGGRLGQGPGRQHRLLAKRFAAAVPWHERVSLSGHGEVPGRRSAPCVSARVEHASGEASPAAAGREAVARGLRAVLRWRHTSGTALFEYLLRPV